MIYHTISYNFIAKDTYINHASNDQQTRH